MPSVSKRNTIISPSEGLKQYISNVFRHMSMGLLVSAIMAYTISLSPQLVYSIFSTPLFYIVLLGPVAIAWYLQSRMNDMTQSTASLLFYIYAASLGVSLSSIFLIYSLPSIVNTFLTTALLFGVMSIYGYVTQKDLTNMGSFFMMGLFGLIISMLINMWLQSSALDWALSIIGTFIFIGLTAYDMQKIKWVYSDGDDQELSAKKSIIGALILYLDFVNLFLLLLRLMGNRRGRD